MADVRPFCGVRFDPDRTGALGGVLCPPFDEINAERRDDLLSRSAHNVVRLESPRAEHDGADIYAQSAAQLKAWLSEGVLAQDGQSTYYVMQETYASEAGPRQRVGVFAAIHLEEYERAIVLPHEYTRRGPKEDRLAMMEACGANFSPIMAMYRDPGGVGTLLWECIANHEPDCTADAPNGVSYRLWLLNDPETVNRLRDLFKPIPIYIADGHHRYETALAYRDNVRGRERVRLDSQASEFVLMCLIEFDDPGMQLHSFHRALSGLSTDKLSALQEQVYGLFTVESRPLGGMNLERMDEFLNNTWRTRNGKPALGLIEPEEGRLSVLSLRGNLGPGTLPHAPAPEMYQCEAWLLHSAVLDPVLGGSSGDQAQVDFVPELDVLLGRVERGDCQAAFLVPPLDLAVFESLVREGQRLPPKTTYFLPKLPTGLVMNLLTGDV